jgi:hypothetical protein
MGIDVPPLVEDSMMRTLAKRAEDRFEAAREWRKILEAALKEGDVALTETQKVDRSLLEGRGRIPAATPTAPTRAPTATPIADSLEPSDTGMFAKRSKLPWLIAGAMVLGGGAAAAVLLAGKSKAKPAGYQPKFALEGVTIVAGEPFGKRLVETDGSVTPAEIEHAFDAALAELRDFHPGSAAALEIPELVFDEIVAIPRAAFCNAKLYEAYPSYKPADCQSTGGAIVLGTDGRRLMVVVGDRQKLAASIRDGLVQVVCRFQSDDAFSTAVCTRAEDWAKAAQLIDISAKRHE